jgi:polyribonucleotide nucleotidyltransferase
MVESEAQGLSEEVMLGAVPFGPEQTPCPPATESRVTLRLPDRVGS